MKTKFFLCMLSFCIVLTDCSMGIKGEAKDEDFYSVYKNFSSFSARSVIQDGVPVVGVLLKHSSEGAYNQTVYSQDTNTFSIYCLFDEIGTNGDNMQFNYVLYVPEDIFVKYKEANGKNPDSGNAFWWYMVTYYKLDMQTIQSDWSTVITTLCTQTQCPKAKIEDIGYWAY